MYKNIWVNFHRIILPSLRCAEAFPDWISNKPVVMKSFLRRTMSGLFVLLFLTSSVTCKPTPSPQFPFTVLPKKGESFRKPFKQPRGKTMFLIMNRGMKNFTTFYFQNIFGFAMHLSSMEICCSSQTIPHITTVMITDTSLECIQIIMITNNVLE